MKNIWKYLKLGSLPAIIINVIWHFTSITHCEMWERIAGWTFVWLFVSAAIWTFSGVRKKVRTYLSKKWDNFIAELLFSE